MKKFTKILESIDDPIIEEINYIFLELRDLGFDIEIKPYWEDGVYYLYNKFSQHLADKNKDGFVIKGISEKLVNNNPFEVIKYFNSIQERMNELGYELEDRKPGEEGDNSSIIIRNRFGNAYEFYFPFKKIK